MFRMLLSLTVALICLEVSAQISSFPHNESFEGSTFSWNPLTTYNGTGTPSPKNLWIKKNTNFGDSSGSTASSTTGPSAAQDGNYFIYTEASSNYNKTIIAQSESYNLSGKTSANVSFYYHMYGSSMGSLSLEVSVNGGSSWTVLWNMAGQQHSSYSSPWSNVNISLNNYLQGNVILQFKGVTGSSWAGDMAVDNITVDASGSTGSPDLTVESLSASSSATAGNNITASCSIRNSGTGAAAGSTMAYYISTNSTYDASDIQLGIDPVGSLSAGTTSAENASLTIPSGLTTGTYYILFRADYTNAVAESNENNNVGARPISITALPSCSDGIQNGDETGIDCGGSCPACPPSGSSLWSQNGSSIYYNSGNVGIGISNPQDKLAVNGTVVAKEYRATVTYPWPDYVFHTNYKLPTLEEVESYIRHKGHLMNIPSAAEVEKSGIMLAEMNARLLEKIEELTLYLINLNTAFEQQSDHFQEKITKLQKDLNELKTNER